MQICNDCKKPIRYIATNKKNVICCDYEEKIFYSLSGTQRTGFVKHECKGEVQNG